MNRIKAIFAGLKWAILVVMLIVLALLCSNGCSAAKQIARSAAVVNTAATDIRSEVVGAKQDLKAGNVAGVGKHLTAIDGHAVVIQTEVRKVQENIPGVQDRVPYWLSTIKWAIVAVSIGGIVFLLWRLNIFLFLESFIQKLVNGVAKGMGA